MLKTELENGFEIRSLDPKEFAEIQRPHFGRIFANRVNDAIPDAGSNSSSVRPRAGQARDERYELCLGLYHHNELVGWHAGAAVDHETYYMRNSAVLEGHRNKGLYSRFLTAILERLRDDGFQVVTSLHHPNNPAVIIPKLRAGFVISGMQFHERFRFLVEMRLYFDVERRKAFGSRMGLEL